MTVRGEGGGEAGPLCDRSSYGRPRGGVSARGDGSQAIRVQVPRELPHLEPGAARALLRLLLRVAHRSRPVLLDEAELDESREL